MATVVTSDVVLEDIDMGYDAIKRSLTGLGGARIETGLFGRQAEKGVWQELGTSDIPARPWLSVAADQGKNVIASAMATAVDDVAMGTPAKPAMENVGEVSADVARSILGTANVGGPALAPATVARKGSSAKLVDSGDMKRAVQSKVRVRP
jgi:hypothetical protein